MKLKRIEKTINSKEEIHQITFDEKLAPRTAPARKQGRPRYKWAEKGTDAYWNSIKNNFKYSPMNDYDPNNSEQRNFMKTYASASIQIPKETWSQTQNTEPKWNKDKTRSDDDPHTQAHNTEEIRLYTDGSCPENSKVNIQNSPAGWGIAIYKTEAEDTDFKLSTGLFGPVETKHRAPHFLGAELGSNNTGELSAICEGLKWLLEQESLSLIHI